MGEIDWEKILAKRAERAPAENEARLTATAQAARRLEVPLVEFCEELDARSLLPAWEEKVQAAPRKMQIWWQRAADLVSDDPRLLDLAGQLNLSADDLHAICAAAVRRIA